MHYIVSPAGALQGECTWQTTRLYRVLRVLVESLCKASHQSYCGGTHRPQCLNLRRAHANTAGRRPSGLLTAKMYQGISFITGKARAIVDVNHKFSSPGVGVLLASRACCAAVASIKRCRAHCRRRSHHCRAWLAPLSSTFAFLRCTKEGFRAATYMRAHLAPASAASSNASWRCNSRAIASSASNCTFVFQLQH